MMTMGILTFAIVTFFISFLIERINDFDKGNVATYVALLAAGFFTVWAVTLKRVALSCDRADFNGRYCYYCQSSISLYDV